MHHKRRSGTSRTLRTGNISRLSWNWPLKQILPQLETENLLRWTLPTSINISRPHSEIHYFFPKLTVGMRSAMEACTNDRCPVRSFQQGACTSLQMFREMLHRGNCAGNVYGNSIWNDVEKNLMLLSAVQWVHQKLPLWTYWKALPRAPLKYGAILCAIW